ncbi:Putative phage abortive infection protein [Epibacterium ulvae]|uniref:Putative phage abortive infection protein n=1 Tax=Epibacterium ulvae TaxID=1156985 RepID=A0A1G5PWD9_9RHOB|nr:putative phage abortive infection protein [Epibacterium ulvae]SCZ53884.1 Putative phage abortive infection protein [Epibacterium ulvae]
MDWKRYFRSAKGRAAQLARAGLSLLNQRMLKRSQRYLIVWTQRYPFGFFAIVAMVVVILWLLNPIYIRWLSGTVEKAGPLGDSFGALTSLFTGAAFVGLIATLMQQQREIRMQRQDLKLQRDEMKAAREELAGQKGQMELQNQSIKQQMFEQTFFNLLNVFNSYIADLTQATQNEGKEPKKGRDQLEYIQASLTGDYGYTQTKTRQIANKFLDRYNQYSNDLNSYFRLLYNIIRLVDESQVDDKKRYVDILRAQLSDSELVLIALNSERPEGAKLKERAERHKLLKHLPKTINDLPTADVCNAVATLSKAECENE